MRLGTAGRRRADDGGQPRHPRRPGGARPAGVLQPPGGTRCPTGARAQRRARARTASGMWCLGNEMDGPWQIGHKTADEYGRLAAETARAMRMVDPTSSWSRAARPTRRCRPSARWETRSSSTPTTTSTTSPATPTTRSTTATSPASSPPPSTWTHFIDVGRRDRRPRRGRAPHAERPINLSFDEWNVWYQTATSAEDRSTATDWPVAPPLLEDLYTAADAVVVGSLLITLLRHADRVTPPAWPSWSTSSPRS